jgi:hypothetical protein
MTDDEILRFSVPDEHLRAAIYLLGPVQGRYAVSWEALTAEAERRRTGPPSEISLARGVVHALPLGVQGLLGYEAW